MNKTNSQKNMPDFSGKCLSIKLVDDDTNHDLFDPHFEVQGERLFLIGTVPVGATRADWAADCIGAVAWDRVADYFVFDSLQAWEKGAKKSEDYYKKKKKKA